MMSVSNSRRWLRIAACLCVALVAVTAWFFTASEEPADRSLQAPGALAPEGSEEGLLGIRREFGEDRLSLPERTEHREFEVEPAAASAALRGLASLTVHVRRPGGLLAQGAQVRVESGTLNAPPGFDASDKRGVAIEKACGSDGSAVFEDLPFGVYRVSAGDREGAEASLELVFEGDSHRSLNLAMPETREGLIVLVQDVQGAAVPLAQVKVLGGVKGVGLLGMQGEPALEATCDEEGRALFPGIQLEGAVIHAEASDGRKGWAKFTGASAHRSDDPHSRTVHVTVEAPGALRGQLLGRPAGWNGVSRVKAWALSSSHPYYRCFGSSFEAKVEGDNYAIEGLGPGLYSLTFEDSEGLRVKYPRMGDAPQAMPNSLAPIDVTIEAGATTVQNLSVLPGATLSGVVRTAAGEPVSGALVRTTYTPIPGNFSDGFVLHGVNVWRLDSDSRSAANHPLTHRSVRTDASGRYRVASLPAGRLRVEVIASGKSYDRREAVELVDGEVKELEHVLVLAGSIEGLEPGGGYLGVRMKGQSTPAHLAVLPQAGDFFFPGLAEGSYELLRYHSLESVPPVPLVEVAVHAGETTWVDLRKAVRPNQYEVRLVDAYGPVAGAQLWAFGPSWVQTDAEGRAAFGSTFPFAVPMRIRIAVGHVIFQASLKELVEGRGVRRGELVLGNEKLEVRAIGAQGSPTAATLTLDSGDLDHDSIEHASAQGVEVGADGLFAFEHLIPGRYAVAVTFPSGVEVSADVDVPSLGPLDLREFLSGDLTLLVTNAAGSPVSYAFVDVAWWAGQGDAPEDLSTVTEGLGRRGLKADADGRASLRGLPAGALLVRARAPRSFLAPQGPLVTRSLQLNVGETVHLVLAVEEE